MTEAQINAAVKEWETRLPPWAISRVMHGILENGTQLRTKDGRRMGNAHIISTQNSRLDPSRPYYTILTDAGKRVVLNSTEVYDIFWPPVYVCDVAEILRKFDRGTVDKD